MIWAFLFAVLFVIFAWREIYDMAWGGFVERCGETFILFFFTAIVFGIGIGFASLVGLAVPKQWTGPETVKLVSLRGSDGISGHFFLGTGSIGTTQYYFFYKEAGEGYKPGKVEVADNVTVYEEQRQDGQLKVYTYQFSKPVYYCFAFKMPSYRYEFVIPEGSLKKDFVLQ